MSPNDTSIHQILKKADMKNYKSPHGLRIGASLNLDHV